MVRERNSDATYANVHKVLPVIEIRLGTHCCSREGKTEEELKTEPFRDDKRRMEGEATQVLTPQNIAAVVKHASPGISEKEAERITAEIIGEGSIVGLEHLIAIDKEVNRGNVGALTCAGFFNSMHKLDIYVAASYLSVVNWKGYSSLADPALISARMCDFYNGIGAGGTSNWLASASSAAAVRILADGRLTQNRDMLDMLKDPAFASYASKFAVDKPANIDWLAANIWQLKSLGIAAASKTLAEAWMSGEGNSGEAVLVVNVGDNSHPMGGMTVVHDLNRAGFRAKHLSNQQDYEDLLDFAVRYGVSAICLSLASDSDQMAAVALMNYFRSNGHGNINFIGGGAITQNAAINLANSGIKVLALSGDVVDFLTVSKLHGPQPMTSGRQTVQMSYGAMRYVADSGPRTSAVVHEVRTLPLGSQMQSLQSFVPSTALASASGGIARVATYSEHAATLGRMMQIARQESPLTDYARGYKVSLPASSVWVPLLAGDLEISPNAGILGRFGSQDAFAVAALMESAQYRGARSARMASAGAERLAYAIGSNGELMVVSELSQNAPKDALQGDSGSVKAGPSQIFGNMGYGSEVLYGRERIGGISMADGRAKPQALTGKQVKHPSDTYKQVLRSSDRLPKDTIILASLPAGHATDERVEDVKKKPSYLSFRGDGRKKSQASGGSTPKEGARGVHSSPHSAEGAAKRRAARGGSLFKRLMLALLGLLEKASDAFKDFDAAMRDRYTERLLLRSDRFGRMLEKEAATFGIDLHGSAATDYYGVLGIKYTSDQKEIRRAYKELVKKHHPDVSKEIDAGQIMQKINEAYATLNSEQKREYDKTFSSGRKSVRADDARRISDELLGRYMKAREADFEKFRKATSSPMTADHLTAAMDEVCAWSRRFDRVAGTTFKKFIRYGKSVRKLSAANRKLISKTADEKTLLRLRKNAEQLEELTRAYESIERSLSGIRKSLKKEIGAQESEVAKKLRSSVKYS
jgi:curved DNA-binding protein CbpA/methylmalonyl-CoA mutase cobalamin-binding subunit